MSIDSTPTYTNTLVSGELAHSWKKDDVLENIYQNEKATYDSINGMQVNNKGRVIEIVVNSDAIKTKLLSVGLHLGNETVLFRPYNGVFALIKNVPLEASKKEVIELAYSLKWEISGPLPESKVNPQYDILRDGRKIITGRWVCMLDKYPQLRKNSNGNYDFTVKAFGGRIMAFTISHKNFAEAPTNQPDPHNYVRNANAASTADTANTPAVSTATTSNLTVNHLDSISIEPLPKHCETSPSNESNANNLSNPKPSSPPPPPPPPPPPLPPSPPLSSANKVPLSKKKSKSSQNDPLMPHLQLNSIGLLPTPTYKISIKGFKTRNSEELWSAILELHPDIKNQFDCQNYPKPKICTGSDRKPFAVMLLPKHVAETLISKSGRVLRNIRYVMARHAKNGKNSNIRGLAVKNLQQDLTDNEIIDGLRYAHGDHFENISHVEVTSDNRTSSKTLIFHVPMDQLGFFTSPIKINGVSYKIIAAHQSHRTPPATTNTTSSFSNSIHINAKSPHLANRFKTLSPMEDTTEDERQDLYSISQKSQRSKKIKKKKKKNNGEQPMDIDIDIDEEDLPNLETNAASSMEIMETKSPPKATQTTNSTRVHFEISSQQGSAEVSQIAKVNFTNQAFVHNAQNEDNSTTIKDMSSQVDAQKLPSSKSQDQACKNGTDDITLNLPLSKQPMDTNITVDNNNMNTEGNLTDDLHKDDNDNGNNKNNNVSPEKHPAEDAYIFASQTENPSADNGNIPSEEEIDCTTPPEPATDETVMNDLSGEKIPNDRELDLLGNLSPSSPRTVTDADEIPVIDNTDAEALNDIVDDNNDINSKDNQGGTHQLVPYDLTQNVERDNAFENYIAGHSEPAPPTVTSQEPFDNLHTEDNLSDAEQHEGVITTVEEVIPTTSDNLQQIQGDISELIAGHVVKPTENNPQNVLHQHPIISNSSDEEKGSASCTGNLSSLSPVDSLVKSPTTLNLEQEGDTVPESEENNLTVNNSDSDPDVANSDHESITKHDDPTISSDQMDNYASDEDSSSSDCASIHQDPPPDDHKQPKPLSIKTSLTKRRHDSESADDSESRGRPQSKKAPIDIRSTGSVSMDPSFRDDGINSSTKKLNIQSSAQPLTKHDFKRLTKPRRETSKHSSTAPLRQRSPHSGEKSSLSQPNYQSGTNDHQTPAINNSSTLKDHPNDVELCKIGELTINYTLKNKTAKEMKFLSKVKHAQHVHPKDLLQVILFNHFKFHDIQNMATTLSTAEYIYGTDQYEKLTALLLFYFSSQEEEAIQQWPQNLEPLPTTIAANWTTYCQQFKKRDRSTNSWVAGPQDIDKHIAVANDLIKPAMLQSNTLRTVARKRASQDEQIYKHSKPSSFKQ